MFTEKLPKDARKVPDVMGVYARPDGTIWRLNYVSGVGYAEVKPYFNKNNRRWCVNVKGNDGVWSSLSVARLVAGAFCKKEFMCSRVRIKDGDYNNLSASNLEWTTPLAQLRESNARKAAKAPAPADTTVAQAGQST